MDRLMKIYVCVKHVPDSAATITVKGKNEIEEHITFLMNPYDEHAVTEAHRLKETFPETEVIAVSFAKPEGSKHPEIGDGHGCRPRYPGYQWAST